MLTKNPNDLWCHMFQHCWLVFVLWRDRNVCCELQLTWLNPLGLLRSIRPPQHSPSSSVPGRCVNLTLRKIAIWLSKNCPKLDIFQKKIAKNFHFFKKIAIGNFFWKKMKIFGFFFLKKCQVLGNFLTVKWQFSGGSAPQPLY